MISSKGNSLISNNHCDNKDFGRFNLKTPGIAGI